MFEPASWARVLLAEGIQDPDNQSVFDVVGTPIVLGTISLMCCMIFFSVAIHYEWNEDLTPRVANRPKAVLKNALLNGISEKHKNKIYVYPFALIRWAYNLTYKECIVGIPGTGTRKDGWEGPLLKTNLDTIIMLKFTTLLFKIGLLVAVLCLFILIPVNVTSTCDPEVFGNGTCASFENKSGFFKTTFANIPPKIYNNNEDLIVDINIDPNAIFGLILGGDTNDSSILDVDGANSSDTNLDDSDSEIENLLRDFWLAGQTWRVILTLISCLLIYSFTLYLVWHEWIENVALRRAFFLEASHYGQRMIELNKLDLDFVTKKKRDRSDDDNKSNRREESKELPPYVTHPEIRETPPSVGLYSVLYQLPNSMVTYDTDGATCIERQLVATAKFFDGIVPPEPGFSSSVAAVTMIPPARLVANTWKKWKAVESKLQTLRHIRKLIAKAERGNKNNIEAKNRMKSELLKSRHDNTAEEAEIKAEDEKYPDEEEGLTKVYSNASDGKIEMTSMSDTDKCDVNGTGMPSPPMATPSSGRPDLFKYEDFDVKVYARSLGFSDEVDRISGFVDEMDIEEFNVFVYTCALMEGGPGIGKKVLNFKNLETLREEEIKILDELDNAHQEMLDARAAVFVQGDDIEILPDEDSGSGMLKRPSVQRIASVLNNGNIEWKVSQDDFDETIRILESKRDTKEDKKPSCLKGFINRIFEGPTFIDLDSKYYGLEPQNEGKAFVTDIGFPSYAVVTFMSRHSAVIARQCLADGAPTNNWIPVKTFPIYPLADAPQLMLFPRGIMRPVTPTITYTSKKIRRWLVAIFLVLFVSTYTYILNAINDFLWNPNYFDGLDGVLGLTEEQLALFAPTLSGLTQTLLFSICPQIFKFVSNKEGKSTTVESAEQRAMIYFWYFYLIVRYLGQIVVDSFNEFAQMGESVEAIFLNALSTLASRTPTILGPTNLSYIIFSCTITWPSIYFLQINNFLTSIFGLKFINRILKGGGPGTELNFRQYVDFGFALTCMTVLAPLCPLVGPIALMYFVILTPMLRWSMLFVFRPKFDSGGDKWPKLYHMIITSLLLGQMITALTFLLSGNYIEAVFIVLCIVSTLLYNTIVLDKFLRPFRDISLRSTGNFGSAPEVEEDGPDKWLEREEFRRWLVDCHKASYLPTCLSGGVQNPLSAEPAMVIAKTSPPKSSVTVSNISREKDVRRLLRRQEGQKGGNMRRQRFGI